MGNWNYADIWERVADHLPDATALVHGDRRLTWAEVDRRADGIARHLLDAGLERQQAVAQYLYYPRIPFDASEAVSNEAARLGPRVLLARGGGENEVRDPAYEKGSKSFGSSEMLLRKQYQSWLHWMTA